MTKENESLKELLRTLTPEEYVVTKVPTEEELRKVAEEIRKFRFKKPKGRW